MDSRKFLAVLNDTAEAKIHFLENKVRELGNQISRNWRLTGTASNRLFILDEGDNTYRVANYRREKGGKLVIESIRPIKIVEGKKSAIFAENCLSLVNAIEENDNRGMQASFGKMEAQRFSAKVVPASGIVKTRDGRLRTINITPDTLLGEDARPKLIAAIVEGLRDRIIVENGEVVGGEFSNGKQVKLPVTKWSRHKLIARHMREAAQTAYLSPGFQQRVYEVASAINEDKLEDAVKLISPFLQTNEEFTLLNKKQTLGLVENALASVGVFNQVLCEDAATLIYRTNIKINKPTIIKEWSGIAKRSQNPALLDNIRILGESKNFEPTYDKFLEMIFEAISDREVVAGALATTLETLRDRTKKIRESNELSGKLNDLIGRLKDREFDDNAIYEAEDFIATVQEELAAGDSLQNFDQMPGEAPGATGPAQPQGGTGMEPDPDAMQAGANLADELDDEKEEKKKDQPTIVINAPLISIGGKDATGDFGGDDDLDLDLGDDELGDEGEDDDTSLNSLLSDSSDEEDSEKGSLMAGAKQAGQQGAGGAFESRRSSKSLAEAWKKPWEKEECCPSCECDPCCCDDDEDCSDHYKTESRVRLSSMMGSDYGAPIITNAGHVRSVAEAMIKLADKHGLSGSKLMENIDSLAKAGMKAVGLSVPSNKLSAAIDQVTKAFWEDCGPPGHDPCGELGDEHLGDDYDDNDNKDEIDECDMAEDQFKWGTVRRKGGLRRSAIGKRERSVKESITWSERQDDAVLGEMRGVRFILDHGGDLNVEPVILSEDSRVQIDIPSNLHKSAKAAAGVVNGDDQPFVAWLNEELDQLSPPEPEDDAEFDSEVEGAVAKITAKPDGTLSVEVTPSQTDMIQDDEVELDEIGEPEGEEMSPISSIKTDVDDNTDDEEDSDTMPDFEKSHEEEPDGDEFGSKQFGGHEEPDGDEFEFDHESEEDEDEYEGEDEGEDEDEDEGEDEGFMEDKNITSPKSSKYIEHVKDNKRGQAKSKLPAKAGDDIEGFGKLRNGNDKNELTKTARPKSEK